MKTAQDKILRWKTLRNRNSEAILLTKRVRRKFTADSDMIVFLREPFHQKKGNFDENGIHVGRGIKAELIYDVFDFGDLIWCEQKARVEYNLAFAIPCREGNASWLHVELLQTFFHSNILLMWVKFCVQYVLYHILHKITIKDTDNNKGRVN